MSRDDLSPREQLERDVADFKEGMALLKDNRLDEAVERFRRAATTGVDRPMEHYALAVALYKKGEWEEAKGEVWRFLAMSPKTNNYVVQAKAILPVIERKLAERREAGQREGEQPAGWVGDSGAGLEAAREEGGGGARPADPLAQCEAYEAGINAYLRGDYARAEERFREALEEVPGSKHVLNNLGLACLGRREHDRAIECFEKALEMDGGFLEARNNLGLAWNDYGTVKAAAAFEAVLEADPNFFDALVNLGSLYYRKGDLPGARGTWERARALRPADAQVQRNLALFR